MHKNRLASTINSYRVLRLLSVLLKLEPSGQNSPGEMVLSWSFSSSLTSCCRAAPNTCKFFKFKEVKIDKEEMYFQFFLKTSHFDCSAECFFWNILKLQDCKWRILYTQKQTNVHYEHAFSYGICKSVEKRKGTREATSRFDVHTSLFLCVRKWVIFIFIK